MEASGSRVFESSAFRDAFARFGAQARQQEVVPLVPTHGDPSYKNFLVTSEHITFVGWDELMLADPFRDIGPLLWWYIPTTKWSRFFNVYGMEMNVSRTERLFWRVAEHSLDIALSQLERGYSEARAQDFLEDFVAAVQREANPKFGQALGGS